MFQNVRWNLELGEQGVLSPGRWLWLRSITWASLLFAAGFFFFCASLFLGHWLHLPSQSSYATALGVPLVAFWLYAIAVRRGERRTASEVLPTRSSVYDFLVGAAIGAFLIIATNGLLWVLGLYHVELHHWKHWYDSFIFDSFVSGMLEELLFRAILLRIFARAFGIRSGLIVSSLCFGAAHLGHASWPACAEIVISGGVVLGLLYMASGQIWMSVGMHIAWDFVEESIPGMNSHNGLSGSLLGAVMGCVLIVCILWAKSLGLFGSGQDITR